MNLRNTLVLPLVLVTAFAHSQQAINATPDRSAGRTLIGLRLGHYLKSADPTVMVNLFLEGPTSEMERVVREHGGTVKMKMRNWTSARMPAGRIRELDGEPAIRSIQCSMNGGQTLNDSMRVKTHIDWVQQGLAPLPQGYDGDGVVIGIVDTGLDLGHPDLQDSLGGTRVLHYWDHHQPVSGNTPAEFGYGQEWNKDAIDAGDCPVGETDNGGHGTTVAGTAAGNGGHSGHYIGAAPKADVIIVSTQFGLPDWSSTVADGVKYVFDAAEQLGQPAVVNLSLGSYLGSHDGLDPAALLIDSMITAAPGRSVVCAAGNSACFPNYQLRMDVDSDTAFAWFKTNSGQNNAFGGVPTAYIDFWADTADLNDVWYSVGADRVTGGYAYRGRIPFRNVQGTVNALVVDTLRSIDGNQLAVCSTFANIRGGQYNLEVLLFAPDSADYYWRIMMTGNGLCDAWDNNGFGLSELVNSLSTPPPPTVAEYAPMANYVFPTIERGIVDSWACSPHVIGVANYNNIQQYTAINGVAVDIGGVEGDISPCSSHGLTRTGLQKPDIAAPGDVTFSAIPLGFIPLYLANPNAILALGMDTLHVRAGGTSIASPAVTGAVALYLQKCPYATQAQIMAALTGAAFPDDFTGAVPNNIFGHGKLDAFAPMVATNFTVNATSNDLLFCPGDSSEAQGQAGFEDYIWSDGTTTMNAWSQGEPLVLTVINDVGCLASTDTLFFSLLPEPTAPVITDAGGFLSTTPADGYQWYLNGTAVPGATGQLFAAPENGDYTVVITAPNGCTAESDIYTLLNTGAGEATASGFRVWPVPANGTIFVTVEGGVALTYDIVDAAGRSAKRGALRANGTSVLDIASLAPGIYTIRTSDSARTGQRTFVVR